MENLNQQLLDEEELGGQPNIRRRQLLPTWIKCFVWIFMLMGLFIPAAFVWGLMGIDFNIALYGLETSQPLSIMGFFLLLLFIFKGIIAFGLWTEKDWAVNLAYLDAVLGIAICLFVMIVLPFLGNTFFINIRLELLALVPYLYAMTRIKPDWNRL